MPPQMFIIARHAEPQRHAPDERARLTPEGVAAAEDLGERIKARVAGRSARVLCSGLTRNEETGAAIAHRIQGDACNVTAHDAFRDPEGDEAYVLRELGRQARKSPDCDVFIVVTNDRGTRALPTAMNAELGKAIRFPQLGYAEAYEVNAETGETTKI